MAYPIETLFEKMQWEPDDSEELKRYCIEAGFEDAIDPAFLSQEEAVEVTGGDSRLAGLLIEAGKRARPLVESWSQCGVRAGRGGGGGLPGSPELVQGPRSSDLPPRLGRADRLPEGLIGRLVSSGRLSEMI